jgi:acyl-CoA thioesterase FadM
MEMQYLMEDADQGLKLATGASVLVAYDYHNQQSIPIPDEWRKVISDFEGLAA